MPKPREKPKWVQLAIDVPGSGAFPAKDFKMTAKQWDLKVPAPCGRAHDDGGRLDPCSARAVVVVELNGARKALCAYHRDMAIRLGRL